ELIIMKEDVGNIYYPQYFINTIGNLEFTEGYHIKMSSQQTLTVVGYAAMPENTPMPLPSGWQNISYLRQSAAPLDSMFSNISANIIISKNTAGQVFWPQYGINTINQMFPGEGYQIKMLNADTLLYPAN
ncbi:MAG: hypothetical protein U9R19_18380, partial [Bacteroidota bacterium]|nr:hypothetical protein [Bacteroidota bacterium]